VVDSHSKCFRFCRSANEYRLTLGYRSVNVFYRINQERPDPSTVIDIERSRQELEFKIGSMGFSGSSGILLAALLAVPTEVQLCRIQVARMKMLCEGL
jgi:battenin